MENKKEQDYLIYILIFMSTAIGVFLRLKYLDVILPWGDEKATLYFAKNLNTIFEFESHSPLYYYIARLWSWLFGESIFVYRSLNIFFILSCSILFLAKFLNEFKWEAVFIYLAWWLNPLSIIADRQARPYGIYFDLALLLAFALSYQQKSKKITELFIGGIGILMLAIQPLSGILILFNLLDTKLTTKNKIIRLSILIFPIAYYFVKYICFGKSRLLLNIEWIQNDFYTFLKSLILMFGGDYYPLTKFYPLSPIWVFSLIILILSIFYQFNDEIHLLYKEFLKQIFFTLVIVFLIKICGVNLMINRYYLFLVPMLIVLVSRSIKFHQEKAIYMRLIIFLVGVIMYNFVIFRPWKTYEIQDKTLEGIIYQIEGSK